VSTLQIACATIARFSGNSSGFLESGGAIDDHGSVDLRRRRVGNVAVGWALMPYFQRTSLNDRSLPISGAPGSAGASGAAAPIVEQAAAILDRETAQETTGTGGVGSGRDRDDGLLPVADLPGLADLQKRASEVFAAFLEGFARPESLATSRAPTDGAPAATTTTTTTTVPIIEASSAVKAGQTTTVAVRLVNERNAPTDLILYSTDFVSDTGAQIPALQVTFAPRTLALAGRAHGHAQMKIAIPAQSAPGLYSALVQAVGLGRPSAVVVLQVE
jgi:hypothetical protein